MELAPEDAKLVTLAKAARARTSTVEGAAVRDQDGRTYVAVNVDLPSLQLDALPLAVAMAASSGARSLDAAAVVRDYEPDEPVDTDVVADLGGEDVPVYVADADGSLVAELSS